MYGEDYVDPRVQEIRDGNRLLSLPDLDPERWKPMGYSQFCTVSVLANGVGSCIINTMNQPFIVTRIGTVVVGNTVDWESTGLINDGQYLVHYSDEQRQYIDNPTNANLLWGPHIEGANRDLQYPIYFAGNHALKFTVTNLYQRILTPEADDFTIQILVSGLADHGKLQGHP